MRTWAKSGRTVLLTASFVALGAGVLPGAAFADTTDGTGSVLGGNQVEAPISAPIDISGNALAVFGDANASSTGGSKVVNKGGGGGGNKTDGKHSIGGGNQVTAPISAPVNACGNAVAIFGTADAGCKGGAKVVNKGGGGGNKTDGKHSVLGGNQVTAPISAPVDACGNAVALFGSSEAGCKGGSKVINEGGSNGDVTSGKGSVGGGNQIYAPISAPVDVCGNSAAIFGDAVAGCKGGAKVVNHGGTGGMETNGEHSVLGGNQVDAPISAPVSVCGNAVGKAAAGCEGGSSVENTGRLDPSGKGSIGGGNQVHAPVSVPVSACGNAAAVLGDSAAMCEGGSHVHSSVPGGMHTNGEHSVLGGNQVYAPITAPITVCGNAVLGAAASCEGGVEADGSGAPHATTGGKNSVGGGNQAFAPAKAPVEVCGTNASCQEEKLTPSRLPVVPGLTKALPVSGALPALPVRKAPAGVLPLKQLNGAVPVSALPMRKADGVPGLLSGLPGGDLSGLSGGIPATGLPLRKAPKPDAVGGLLGGLLGGLPTAGVPGGLPTGRVPAPSLPAPSLPVTGDLQAPAMGGTLDQVQQVTELTDALPMSASAGLPGSSSGSPWVLAVGALMAAASVTGAFARRLVRRG
ncbi:chaplin family protein [Actinocorallia longicatena]|uniref:Chaplin domain-containing protein n=1 Tax=Actinocorallia longicatena TaxID=111803 RepID=A0ABP6QDW7_9ACTN